MGPHVTERLSAYMDGELAEADRAQVEAHVLNCPACTRHLEELRAVDAAARDLPLEVPEGYFEAFPGRVRRRLGPAARPRSRYTVPLWLGAAAAAVVLALLTPRLLLREPQSRVVAPAAERTAGPAADAAPAAPPATVPGPARPVPPPALPAKTDSRDDARLADAGARTATRAESDLRAGVLAGRTREPEQVPMPAAPAASSAPVRQNARAAGGTAAPGYAEPPPAADELQPAPREAEAKAKTEADGRIEEREQAKEQRDKAAFGSHGLQESVTVEAKDGRFDALLRKTAATPAEARALRDAWRALAREAPAGPRADEARVRAVEAGAEAWRRGRDEKDRAEAQKEGREYLERPDALQRDRVRAVLRSLSP